MLVPVICTFPFVNSNEMAIAYPFRLISAQQVERKMEKYRYLRKGFCQQPDPSDIGVAIVLLELGPVSKKAGAGLEALGDWDRGSRPVEPEPGIGEMWARHLIP
jgi:hypothetical protein